MPHSTLLISILAISLTAENAPALEETRVRTTPFYLSSEAEIGEIEPMMYFNREMPTGVAVSHDNRIFVSFPRWGDKVDFTVAEITHQKLTPYPNASLNELLSSSPAERFVSVQSVVIDPKNRLWILDTGRIAFRPTVEGGPKLIGVDLEKNDIFKTIVFPPDVALPTSYLNDVRFDLRRGREGVAFITDSSETGPNGIIVVDLQSGHSRRRLNDHFSTKADPTMLPIVEGQPFLQRQSGEWPKRLLVGSDGIAIAADGRRLYYCPLISRHLFSVDAEALADILRTDAQVAATVRDEGEKGASAGLESDAQGRIYATNYEHDAILRRNTNGLWETLVHDVRVLWPDSLSLARDGYLYFTVNQLDRMARFHDGTDLRRPPYVLFRVRVPDATPIMLR
jgi:sugar lactone lactonase YvrE